MKRPTSPQAVWGALRIIAGAALVFTLSIAHASDPPHSVTNAVNHANLLVYRDARGELRPVRTRTEWQIRRAAILKAMQEVMGPLPSHSRAYPPRLEIREEREETNYLQLLITYESEPGSQVPAYLLVPKKTLHSAERSPAVLCLHPTDDRIGHRVVIGNGEKANREYARELAERGFVTLAPAYPLLAQYQPDLAALGYQSGTMKAIWDNIRGLDLLNSLSFVRPEKFGAIGHSLGGHNALFTAVFDERIQVVVTSCGFDSFVDYMNGNIRGWTSNRYMPKLLDYPLNALPFDFNEVIGALAPRSCYISAPFYDDNFKWRSVYQIQQSALPIYKLHRAADQLRVEHPRCAHDFPEAVRETAYELLENEL